MSETVKDNKEYYFVKSQPRRNGEAYIVMYYYKGNEIWNEIFAAREKAQAKCDKLNDALSKIKKVSV